MSVEPTTARTSRMDFGPLSISYDQRVLEPRPWVRAQSEWAAEILRTAESGPILELCCGAGHIGLLATHLSQRPIVCVDANPAACDFTRANAEDAGIGDLVEVRHGRFEDVVLADERFPLVVADPPWVTTAETGRYPEDPLSAIDGGSDGLSVARACLDVAGEHLVPGGSLLLQLGTVEQAETLEAERSDLSFVELRQFERGVVLHLVRSA